MPVAKWSNLYLGQLIFINKKVRVLVEKILSRSDNPPIIVLQADHGWELTRDDDNVTNEAMIEKMKIFNAYHLPGNGKSLLYDSITPVNTFRLIFKYYFGAKLDLLKDYSYYSNLDAPYKFKDVTNMLMQDFSDKN